MKKKPTYLTGEEIREGDEVLMGEGVGTIELIVLEGFPQRNEYWKDVTGEGVMVSGAKAGRLFARFHDEDLVFVRRKDGAGRQD